MERWLPKIYLVFGVVLTALLCFVTAPFAGPDEPNQSCRAISLSRGIWLAKMGHEEAGAQIDAGALEAMDGMNDIRMEWESHSKDFHDRRYGSVDVAGQQKLASVRWAGRTVFVPFGNTAVYPPGLYGPAMLGWRVGEAAGWTIFASLRLARLLCALTAVGLGWLALRLCACSRWMLLPFLLLPSTLFLNATCSQDAVLLGVAALVAAILSRPLVAGRQFSGWELAVMTLLLTLCGSARPPYAAMAVVLFLPGVEVRERDWRRWMGPVAGFVAVAMICTAWRHMVSRFGFDGSDQAHPELQALFLWTHPFAAGAALLRGTVEAGWDFFERGTYVVGWNDLLPHHGAAAVLGACMAAMVLFGPACPVRTWKGWALLGVGVAAPLLGISLAEYVIWTPPGFYTVYGVQPRYWLPLLPLAMMLVQGRVNWRCDPTGRFTAIPRSRSLRDDNKRTEAPGRFSHFALVGAGVVMFAMAATLPWMAAEAFYRSGVVADLRINLR